MFGLAGSDLLYSALLVAGDVDTKYGDFNDLLIGLKLVFEWLIKLFQEISSSARD